MAEPAGPIVEELLVEIIAPAGSRRGTIVCECCRQRKHAGDFDEDSFGICTECLASDALLIDAGAGEWRDRSSPS